MARYRCDQCLTTMEDIENVNLKKLERCDKCYQFAIECWRFAIACAGDLAKEWLIERMMSHEKPA